MNVLVTGGSGFIGSNLCAYHLRRGDTVVAVDDLSTGFLENLAELMAHERFTFIEADVRVWPDLDEAVHKANRVYHLAAVLGMFRVLREPVAVTSVNVGATERVLSAAATSVNSPQVVIASSSSVYGHSKQSGDLCENVDVIFSPKRGGLSGYAMSKFTNEIQAKAYHQEHGLNVVIPRFFNVVGPHQAGNYGFVIPRFIKQALEGEPLTVFGDGSQTRSFCNVNDTITALDKLAETSAANGEVVNVGNAHEISILDLAKLVIERAESASSIEFVPFDKAYGEKFDHITQRKPVVDKLKRLTGFTPQLTLEETIDDLLKSQP